jgi:hypothetical protein
MRAAFSFWLLLVLAACASPQPTRAEYVENDVRAFVRGHRVRLQEEAKIGSGSTLYDLGIRAGCQDIPELNRRLHKDYEQIFSPPASDADVAERVVDTLAEHRELRCIDLYPPREGEFVAGRRQIGPRRPASY